MTGLGKYMVCLSVWWSRPGEFSEHAQLAQVALMPMVQGFLVRASWASFKNSPLQNSHGSWLADGRLMSAVRQEAIKLPVDQVVGCHGAKCGVAGLEADEVAQALLKPEWSVPMPVGAIAFAVPAGPGVLADIGF